VTGIGIPAFLLNFPGAVLQLTTDGEVISSNGRLERELDRPLVGTPFATVLDEESSAAKWTRFLHAASASPGIEGTVVELVLSAAQSLPEPRPFAILRDPAGDGVWVLEMRSDPRMDTLREQVTGINSELASTQRELLKERGRLSRALSELEAKHAEAGRLAQRVQEQNEELERRNEALLALTGTLQHRTGELERINRDLDEFAHVISHDLKAPLRNVAIYASWLEEDLEDVLTPESREHLSRLHDRTERMRAMIDGVLAYARAGRGGAAPTEVDVGELVRSVVLLLDPPESATIEIAPELPTLFTGRSPLQQVFLNLLANALRFAPAGREWLQVEWKETDEQVEFTIRDNGPGIPPEQLERIWGLFQTLGTEEENAGTGIGLAVVRRLVEREGGRVWAESSEGAGATFRFLWPRGSPGHTEAPETGSDTP
jgi:signal transduction histidine kinase